MILTIGLIIIGTLARFIPHVPNFTPVIAMALFGGLYLKRKEAWIIPLAIMSITDIVLGLHATILFTWGSIAVITLYGQWLKNNRSWKTVMIGSIASAVLFFIVTNFGAWLAYYPKTLSGLMSCYTLAIPFFRMTLLSSLAYSVILCGSYELIANRVKGTRFSFVLN